MMQRDDPLLLVVDTTAVNTTLALLAARGIDAATMSLRVTPGGAIVEVLGPASLDRDRAIAAAAALAVRPETRRAAVMALRRLRRVAAGSVYARAEVASWARSPDAPAANAGRRAA